MKPGASAKRAKILNVSTSGSKKTKSPKDGAHRGRKSPRELAQIAKQLVRAKTKEEVKRLKNSFVKGFYGSEPTGPIAVLGYAKKIRNGPMKQTSDLMTELRAAEKPYQEPKLHDPVVWQGKDLSTDATIMFYSGKCYVRPIGRGVVLNDLEFEPHLDDVLPDGNYEIELSVVQRLPVRRKKLSSSSKAITKKLRLEISQSVRLKNREWRYLWKAFRDADSELLRQAAQTFGGAEGAGHFLSRPQPNLGGKIPIYHAATVAGMKDVTQLMGRIEYGVLA